MALLNTRCVYIYTYFIISYHSCRYKSGEIVEKSSQRLTALVDKTAGTMIADAENFVLISLITGPHLVSCGKEQF